MTRLIGNPIPPAVAEPDNTELVPASDPRSQIISIDPERLWGTPCFVGTRLPVKSLFDHLERGRSLEEFLADFEGVSRDACVTTLRMAFEALMTGLPNAR